VPHVPDMSRGRSLGFGLLGAVIGAATGVGVGLLAGLAYSELAAVASFEGASGYAVAFWMLAGLVLGAVVGLLAGLKMARRTLD
jgi:ABC-type antimicrobial peptide transport system permease subunit